MPTKGIPPVVEPVETESVPSVSEQSEENRSPSVLAHLMYIVKMWWHHLTMRVSVSKTDMEFLMENCGLQEKQITSLYKQFRLLVGDNLQDHLTVKDLERHSSLLASHPLKKYTYRLLFWNSEQLSFTQFVSNLSLMLSNCIGCPQLHLVKSMQEMGYFKGASGPKEVAQMQKLLALFNCFDLKETGCLDTQALCPLLHDLLRCDSDLGVSSLVPHSMISRMVNTAIVNVHVRFPRVCDRICNGDARMSHNGSIRSLGIDGQSSSEHFEGHRMLLTKEMFIRDQEDLHLDQLMAMRL